MMCFAVSPNAQITAGIARLHPFQWVPPIVNPKAYAIAFGPAIEAPAADQTRSSETASVPRFAIMRMVQIGSCANEKNHAKSEPSKRPAERLGKCAAMVNVLLQPEVETFRVQANHANGEWAGWVPEQFIGGDIRTDKGHIKSVAGLQLVPVKGHSWEVRKEGSFDVSGEVKLLKRRGHFHPSQ